MNVDALVARLHELSPEEKPQQLEVIWAYMAYGDESFYSSEFEILTAFEEASQGRWVMWKIKREPTEVIEADFFSAYIIDLKYLAYRIEILEFNRSIDVPAWSVECEPYVDWLDDTLRLGIVPWDIIFLPAPPS